LSLFSSHFSQNVPDLCTRLNEKAIPAVYHDGNQKCFWTEAEYFSLERPLRNNTFFEVTETSISSNLYGAKQLYTILFKETFTIGKSEISLLPSPFNVAGIKFKGKSKLFCKVSQALKSTGNCEICFSRNIGKLLKRSGTKKNFENTRYSCTDIYSKVITSGSNDETSSFSCVENNGLHECRAYGDEMIFSFQGNYMVFSKGSDSAKVLFDQSECKSKEVQFMLGPFIIHDSYVFQKQIIV
jgi:hypothetical protein